MNVRRVFTLAQRRLPGDVVVNGSEGNEANEVCAGYENERKVKEGRGAESAATDRDRRHFKNYLSSFSNFHCTRFREPN